VIPAARISRFYGTRFPGPGTVFIGYSYKFMKPIYPGRTYQLEFRFPFADKARGIYKSLATIRDSTGEYCRSLFQVMLISLMASWVTAITITPLLGVMFLKIKSVTGGSQEQADPYSGLMYRAYKKLLLGCLRFRWGTMVVMAGMLVLAVAIILTVGLWAVVLAG